MASTRRQGSTPAGSKHNRAGLVVRLVLLAAASSAAGCGASVASAFVTPPLAVGKTSTLLRVRTTAKTFLSSARMSVDTAEKKTAGDGGGGGGGSGGGPTLAVAVVGGGGVSAAVSAANVQTAGTAPTTNDDATGAAVAAGGALGPGVAAEEAKLTMGNAVRQRKVKSVARALPGTWWAAGLPKWMHTVRRRMTTKEDFLHLHAASGGLYIVGGSLYLLNVMGMELFAGIPQLDMTSALPLCVLWAGLVNTLSAIPMANTRSWVLNGLCVSVMQLWYAWYVSGIYPASLAPADPWLAAASLAVLVIACVEAEEGIQQEQRTRELLAESGRRGKKQSGPILMRGEDHVEGDAVSRYGSLATLIFNGPHLYATLVGGGWVDRLAEAYPAAPALLFHAYVALVTSNSIALLAPTLYQRRLVDAKGMAAMQFLTFAPIITSLIDASVMGSAATNNPIEIYLGFLH